MAPTFRHGKGVRVLMNQYDMSPFLNQAKFTSLDAPIDKCFEELAELWSLGYRRFAYVNLEGLGRHAHPQRVVQHP